MIAEPKYKYGQQEQVTVRNHNRSTALEVPAFGQNMHVGQLVPAINLLDRGVEEKICMEFNGNG